MRLAFYAPMKPPTHGTPSGDRTIARNLMLALEGLGAEVSLASEFVSREGKGEAVRQEELIAAAEREAGRLLAADLRADAWVTYHNYYKAPDLIGPRLADALSIPYVQVESTRARKRLTGPWAAFARQAEAAAERADLIFYFTQRDAEALAAYAPPHQRLHHLRPFLPRAAAPFLPRPGRMLAVGMMRERDKLPSYALIAESLHLLGQADLQLEIAGDGPARPQVEALMAPFGARVRFLGALAAEELEAAYGRAGIFLWPGVNEAIGMTYLEAQAQGLAIVAQARPGLEEILPQGAHPAPEAGAKALAARLARLLSDPGHLEQEQRAARDNFVRHHGLARATESLRAGLAEIGLVP